MTVKDKTILRSTNRGLLRSKPRSVLVKLASAQKHNLTRYLYITLMFRFFVVKNI